MSLLLQIVLGLVLLPQTLQRYIVSPSKSMQWMAKAINDKSNQSLSQQLGQIRLKYLTAIIMDTRMKSCYSL